MENIITGYKSYKKLNKWLGYDFDAPSDRHESGQVMEFKEFVRDFRAYVKKVIPDGFKLVKFSGNWFTAFGFIACDFINAPTRYVYFSISDVRHWPGAWHKDILIRTAKSDADYTGGRNCSTSLDNFPAEVEYLMANGDHNDK